MVKNFCFYLTHKDVSKCYKRHLCAQDVLQCILESFFPLYWNKFSSENYGRLSPCSNLEVCLRRVLSMLCILFGFPPNVSLDPLDTSLNLPANHSLRVRIRPCDLMSHGLALAWLAVWEWPGFSWLRLLLKLGSQKIPLIIPSGLDFLIFYFVLQSSN